MSRVVMLYADAKYLEMNASTWRVEIPFRALKAKGYDIAIDHISRIQSHLDSDVFVIERNLLGPFYRLIKELKEKGKRIIATFDDCYHLMPKYLPAYEVWHGDNDYLKQFEEILGMVDISIVPSYLLADYYSKFGRIEVVENYYPDEWLEIPSKEPRFELGWSGNATHLHSWQNSKLDSALKESNRKFLLNTSDSNVINKLHGLYSAHYPWVHHNDYPSLVDEFMVGLAPLAGEYDSYRSNIKLVNYAVRGRPFVASNLAPYHNCDGGILVKNSKKGWIEGIEEVFNEYEKYSMMARNWAYGYRISANIHKYEELIG